MIILIKRINPGNLVSIISFVCLQLFCFGKYHSKKKISYSVKIETHFIRYIDF